MLELRKLSRHFGGVKAVDELDLVVNKGEILGLIGPNGSGKSTTVNLITGVYGATTGSLHFKGKDISKLSETQLIEVRKNIAYVFQNGALFDSMSVRDNLAYPLVEHTRLSDSEVDARIAKMLDLVKMQGSENLLPASLSGGMQKRVGLARAIILEPEVILYDEPTAGLDPQNTRNLIEIMSKLREHGRSGIFVTHDIPSALDVSDRIAILYNRKIHIVDSVENIKKSQDPVVKAFIEGSVD